MATDSYMPLPSPLGLDVHRICQQPTVLIVDQDGRKEVRVQTADGVPIAFCMRKRAFLSQRREFYDAEQRLLFTLHHKRFSFPSSYYLASGSGDQCLVEFKGKLSFASTNMEVFFTSTATQPPQPVMLKVRGKTFRRNAVITWDEAPVARVLREAPSLKQGLTNSRSWSVEVMPNVDLLLMAVIVMAVDEQRRDQQRASAVAAGAAASG